MKTLWTMLMNSLFGAPKQVAPWQGAMTSYHRNAVDADRYGDDLRSRGGWPGYSIQWKKDALGPALGDWYVLRMVR